MIKIIILGSGTCVPSKRRGSPSIAVYTEGEWCLIDCGSGTLYRMAIAGIDYKSIKYLLFTHKHPDHTAELVPFLFALNYTPDYERNETLEITGPNGFKDFYEQLKTIYPWISPKNYKLKIREISKSTFDLGNINIQTICVKHGDLPSVAYKLTYNHESVVFSGDTGVCDTIVKLSKGSDLLILESSFPTKDEYYGNHLTPYHAGKIANKAGVRNLALTHFYPSCDDYDIKAICSEEYNGNVIITEDFMEIILCQGSIKSITSKKLFFKNS